MVRQSLLLNGTTADARPNRNTAISFDLPNMVLILVGLFVRNITYNLSILCHRLGRVCRVRHLALCPLLEFRQSFNVLVRRQTRSPGQGPVVI